MRAPSIDGFKPGTRAAPLPEAVGEEMINKAARGALQVSLAPALYPWRAVALEGLEGLRANSKVREGDVRRFASTALEAFCDRIERGMAKAVLPPGVGLWAREGKTTLAAFEPFIGPEALAQAAERLLEAYVSRASRGIGAVALPQGVDTWVAATRRAFTELTPHAGEAASAEQFVRVQQAITARAVTGIEQAVLPGGVRLWEQVVQGLEAR